MAQVQSSLFRPARRATARDPGPAAPMRGGQATAQASVQRKTSIGPCWHVRPRVGVPVGSGAQ